MKSDHYYCSLFNKVLFVDLYRTDIPSLASANRKNLGWSKNQRKFIGRKIDGIIYIINGLHELGAIEVAKEYLGTSDNKYLLEYFKMPKTLHDMLSDLIKAVNSRSEERRVV